MGFSFSTRSSSTNECHEPPRDADDLKKRIAELKRDTSQEAENARSSLERKLDDESRDLKDLELTIRDLSNAMK